MMINGWRNCSTTIYRENQQQTSGYSRNDPPKGDDEPGLFHARWTSSHITLQHDLVQELRKTLLPPNFNSWTIRDPKFLINQIHFMRDSFGWYFPLSINIHKNPIEHPLKAVTFPLKIRPSVCLGPSGCSWGIFDSPTKVACAFCAGRRWKKGCNYWDIKITVL